MSERKTGVSGSVKNTQQSNSGEALTITLTVPEDDDTIYNVVFKDYDEEKNE